MSRLAEPRQANRQKRGSGRAILLAISTLAISMFVPPMSAPASAQSYRLGAQDKLRIKVIEWRAGKSEYQEWTALGADYTVNASGRISMPLIGEVTAEGRSTEELAISISEGLQKRAGLISRPDASVEVIQYRPIYILGGVDRPGEYAYRPGVSVLQAIGIAGGFHRPTEGGLLRLERDRIAATGNYETARLDLRRMLARRARLEAELADAAKIRTPDELSADPGAHGLIAEEASILTARSDALRSQLTALSELRELYSKEIESLQSKKITQEKQVGLARRELKSINSLVEKGLVVTSREFALERVVADLESKMLDIETALVRSKQEMRKSERDSADLVKDRKAKTASELRETRASIEQLVARLNTSNSLINEAAITAPRLALERSATSQHAPTFSILRRVDGNFVNRAADDTTLIEPGDVLRVETGQSGPTGSAVAVPDSGAEPTNALPVAMSGGRPARLPQPVAGN